jgi:hypothetical protein
MNKCLSIEATDIHNTKRKVHFEHISENVVFQNTSFWGGGCFDMWDSYQDENDDKVSVTSHDSNKFRPSRSIDPATRQEKGDIKPQTHSDKLLEMMSFKSLFHMGQIQIGMAKADRLFQGKSFSIDYGEKSPLYVHVDGEGYMINEPCHIEVSHSDQISMNINKVKTKTSKYLGDILHVLNKAVDDRTITREQNKLLYEKFIQSL